MKACAMSRLKAEAAMQSHPDAVCIGSDTMVTIDRLPLGKPKDRADAADMLRRLRGRTHEVLTGLAVLSPDGGAQTLCTRTEVTFRDFSEEELAELRHTMHEFEESTKTGDVKRIAEADVRFHDIIYHATRNVKLENMLNNLREQMYRYRVEYLKDEKNFPILIREHSQIVEGLTAKDKTMLTAAMHKHVMNQATAVKEMIREQEK